MRILAVAFSFALVGCIDTDSTPEGVDDIEETTDDFGPDVLKGDVDNPEPKRREVGDLGYECGVHNVNCTPEITAQPARHLNDNTAVKLNQVPRR